MPIDSHNQATTLSRFGQHKIIPDLIQEETLLALSHYPELLDTRIRFMVVDPAIKGSVMQAQPGFASMLTPWRKRDYVIKVSRFFRGDSAQIPIDEVPQNILIGWIGHELGHIMDYVHRNSWELIRYGLGYVLSRKYLMKAERRADLYAIGHGLGDKIVATKNFILEHADLPERYKSKIRRLYLSPEETLLLIEEYQNKQVGW